MLASNGMRLARELRSPLSPGPRSSRAAALFFAGDPGRLVAALARGRGGSFSRACCSRRRARPPALVALRAARRARGLVRALGRLVDRARPQLELREPRVRLPRLRPRRRVPRRGAAPAALRLLGAARRRLRLGARSGRCCPWLYEDYGRIARLRGPVGYWNALALLGDIALPIGLCLATRRRTAGTLLVFGWLVVIGLTYSRGGVLVAIVVVALWMLLSERLDRGALDAARGRAARRGRARRRLLALRAHERRPVARRARARDGARLRRRARSSTPRSRSALARFPPPAATRGRGGSRSRRSRSCSSPSLAVGAAHAHALVALVHEPSSAELTNSPTGSPRSGSNFRWDVVARRPGTAWARDRSRAPAPARSSVTNLRYRDVEPRPDDRAARPAACSS